LIVIAEKFCREKRNLKPCLPPFSPVHVVTYP